MSRVFKSNAWNGFFIGMLVSGIVAAFVVESTVEAWFVPLMIAVSFLGAAIHYFRADKADEEGEGGRFFGFLVGLGICGVIIMGIPVQALVGVLIIVGVVGILLSFWI